MKERFCRKNILPAAAVCLFAAFTVFFFSPGEIYTANPTEYLIGVADVIIPMLITAAVITVLLFGVVLSLLAINETLSQIVVRLLLGFTLAGYIQMMFLNGRMAKFTGDTTQYRISDPYVAIDFIVYYVLFLLPVVLYAIKRIKPQGRLSKLPGEMIISALSAAIVLMQTVGLVPGIISAADTMKDRYVFSDYYLSFEPVLSLSKKNNVIVFLTDRLEGKWMQETIDEFPEMNDYLDGFTFYCNSISEYGFTNPSVPGMLSGIDPREHDDYINDIFWSENAVLKPLHDNGYNVNLLIDHFMYNSLDEVRSYGYVDNIRSEKLKYRINYLQYGGIVPRQIQFSLIKMMPYVMKPLFSYGVFPQFANSFIVSESDIPFVPVVGVDSDLAFFHYFKEHGLNADSDKPVFDFVHLNCAHDLSEELAMLYPPAFEKRGSDEISNIRGEFEVLNSWFEEMKRLGIYDNSTIIITGDHGRMFSNDEAFSQKIESPTLTGLLIKPAGTEHAPLKTDSETEMYTPFFSASVLEYAGLDHSALGVSYNDSITQGLHFERVFYPIDFGMYDNRPKLPGAFLINGDATDFANWRYVKYD